MSDSIILKIDVTIDISEYLNIMRYAEKNRRILVELAAERYQQWLIRRFLSLSGGGGHWTELKQSTVDRKEREGLVENPNWILRETGSLLDNITMEDTEDGSITVGYNDEDAEHERSVMSIGELVRHQYAEGRDAIAEPDSSTRRRMAADVKKEFDKIVRRMRKKK